MSDSPKAGAMDKTKRLALMMSMGFGYFKAKRALEEHDWDVDEAVASSLSTTKEEKLDSVAKGKSTDSTKVAGSASMPETKSKHTDGPQLSPDNIVVRSQQMPQSKAHEHELAAASSPAVAASSGEPTSVPDSSSSPVVKEHDAAVHVAFEEPNDASPNENIEENTRNIDASRLRRTPGAFREGGNEDTSEALDSMTPESSPSTTRPYLAVAETVSVPELVHATLQPPAMSAVTTPFGYPIDLPSEAGINLRGEDSAGGRSDRQLVTRRWLFGIAILVIIGLTVGLAVSQTRSISNINQPEAGRQDPTTSPTVAGLTTTPSATSPTPTTSAGTSQPPTIESTPVPTQPPTMEPTPVPTQPPMMESTPTPTQSPTEPPSAPTTERPTSPTVELTSTPTPTAPPAISTTAAPTREPTASPTPLPTTLPTTPPPLPSDDLRVDRVEMVLSGVPRLDGETQREWSNTTADFIADEAIRVITSEDSQSEYEVYVSIDIDSQGEVVEELTLIFSVEFEIDSSLETHDVEEYVLGAFDTPAKRSEYIDWLQKADSSFKDVVDVEVSL